ncbi:MAG: fasciclin domain-containing protein [Flavobacteriales bacterium]
MRVSGWILVSMCGALMMASCAPSGNDAAVPAADSSAVSNGMETSPQPVDRQPANMADSPSLRETDNMSSALRFAETNEQTSMWGALLRQSKWAKMVHHEPYVVLCPTNDRVQDIGQLLKVLQLPENKELLDEIMANHLVKAPFFVEKAADFPEVVTITGRTLKVDAGQHRIGGALYKDVQINTEKGSVVHMVEMIDFPKAKLEKLAKNQK